jgi:hypothetical protein
VSDWRARKQWADRFDLPIRAILGQHLIRPASQIADMREATDLVIGDRTLLLGGGAVGVRVRTPQYLKWPGDYTLRTYSRSPRAEIDLILAGHGNYFFYGIAEEAETGLACWVLIDLNHWRGWYVGELRSGHEPGIPFDNYDNESGFRVFRIADLPTEAIIARQEYCPPTLWSASEDESLLDTARRIARSHE